MSRNFHDALLGDIEVTSTECQIIDTPHFQALRRLQQLGLVSRVYHSAEHSRFGHSLQVMEMTTQLWAQLMKHHPELTELHDPAWKKRVRIAALCHDMGHGPFSHLFDDFISSLPEGDRPVKEMCEHEDRGILLLKCIVAQQEIDLSEADLHYITCMITGVYLPWQHEASIPSAFLFELVANKYCDVDCDKYYLTNDHRAAFKFECELRMDRIFRHTRVKDAANPKERHLIFAEKVAQNVANIFILRRQMHKLVYQEEKVIKLNLMMKQILAGLYVKLGWKDLLNRYEENGHRWRAHLTDDILFYLEMIHACTSFQHEYEIWRRIQCDKLISLKLFDPDKDQGAEKKSVFAKLAYSNNPIHPGNSVQLYKNKNQLSDTYPLKECKTLLDFQCNGKDDDAIVLRYIYE